MSKITKVLYQEIDPSECSMRKASEYYYYLNLLPIGDIFRKEYEQYEESVMKVRANALKGINVVPKMSSVIFGASTVKNKAVIVAEI